ncbi:hypothetical protein HMPREF1544_10195 [Mucor circinelloides 1006PhL]|uniref:Zn(2)-C6 fungal-type domain-containing protein n=1 Tax=Mucor circinelloides f. circinelloides (strain 1006PhL) TaxID=1220926 RepID=S2JKI7_MUCC1|nr:hypothetical protein HMPREF1544_10195 [Mucor circinelloides 1006PhL]
MPLEEQQTEVRRKRAKIVSACGECRRKKTKCNGEHPCRNCEKSGVPCVYPSSSANDDKRNAPSKAALEAIEERLKTIEDMLRTIIKPQNMISVDMDPVVNNFLHRDSKSSSSSVSSPPPPPPPQKQMNTPPPPTSPSQQSNRLPSIRSLSSSYTAEPKLEPRDLPPLGFQPYAYNSNPSSSSCKYQSETEEFMKKRKR